MNTSDILNGAADLIEEKGWNQGGYGNHYDGFCIMGACNVVVDGLDLAATTAMNRYLLPDSVMAWNDRPGRTQAEVIEALRACAVIEAAREDQDAAFATYADVVSA